MQLTKEEAAAALDLIQKARADTRAAFRARRGHWYLWLWGALWILMSGLAQYRGLSGVRLFPWLGLGGGLASYAIGYFQNATVRVPLDRSYLGVIATLLGFAVIFPFVLHPASARPELIFAYIGVVVAQIYTVSGIWFDTCLLWFGLLLTLLILLGVFFFMPVFWFWIAGCCGGSFILTGFYVRTCWR